MRTYKLPAMGLEIMGEDTQATENPREVPQDLKDAYWRFPTAAEFTFLLQLSDELGILGLIKGKTHTYFSREKRGDFRRQMTAGTYKANFAPIHIRLVRDI